MIAECIYMRSVSDRDAHVTQTNLPHCVIELMSGLLDWLGQLEHRERCTNVCKNERAVAQFYGK